MSLALGDFDEDGVVDAAVAIQFPSSVAVHRGDGSGGFLPPTTYEAASPWEIAVADLNEDGHLDLGVSSSNADVVSILLGDGHGQFSPSVGYPVESAWGIAIGDMNGDDHVDVVVTSNAVDSVSVLLGVGDGTLLPGITSATTFSPTSVAIGDWSGDQVPDIAISRELAGGVTLMQGKGDGTFEGTVDLSCDGRANGVHLRDLNGDGRLDVATAVQGPPGAGVPPLSIFLAQTNGTFGPRVDHGVGGARSLAMGDWNSDGALDAAVGLSEPSSGIGVFLGDGSGGFGAQKTFPAGGSTSELKPALITDDAVLDLVALGWPTLEVHPGNGDGTFGGGATYPALSTVTSITVSDFDRDGNWDVAASTAGESSSSESHVSIFPGKGDGAFGPREDYLAGAGFPDLEAGDVDSDGIPDLVLTSSSGGGSVALLRGLGDGSFAAVQEFPCGTDPQDLEVADFNGDGRSDAAVVTLSYPGTLSILLALPGGGFAAPVPYPDFGSAYPLAMTSEDFDKDGNQDIAVLHAGTVSVYLGIGDGTFETPVGYFAGLSSGVIASGDADQDGAIDLVMGGNSGLLLYRGVGDGRFWDGTNFPLNAWVSSIEIGDVDGDGHRDLIAACGELGTLSVLFGENGAGLGTTFTDHWTHFGAGWGPGDVAVGDWSHDGNLDLVAGLWEGAAISVLVHTSQSSLPPAPPAAARLHQNAPNPFNPQTTIRFELNTQQRTKVTVLDVSGRVVAHLLDETRPKGMNQVSWAGVDDSGRRVASGVYFYRLEIPGVGESRKMVLAR